MHKIQKRLALIVMFVVSYLFLMALSQLFNLINLQTALTPLPLMDPLFFTKLFMVDWMLYVMPLIGFFFIYLLMDETDHYLQASFMHSIGAPILFVIFCFIAFYLAAFMNFANFAALSGQPTVNFDFWGLWKSNGFYYFMLAGILGWASHLIMHRLNGHPVHLLGLKKAKE